MSAAEAPDRTVRRAAVVGPRARRVVDAVVADPPAGGAVLADGPAKGWARLRTRAIGICGSDVRVLAGGHPFARSRVDPGHEPVAEVEDDGEGIDPAWIGRRVVM